MDKNKKSRIYLIVLMIAIFAVYTYRQNLPRQVHVTGTTMGTIAYNVKYIDKQARQFKPQIDSLLKDFNQSLSTYIPNSDVSVFNKTGKVTFNFPYFYDVLEASKVIYESTQGAFDPTVGPLIDAWGFGEGEMIGPDSTQVDSLLQYVGFNKIDFTKTKAETTIPSMKLSFSAIAKGQAIDVVADWLAEQDIANYMVEIGGEVRAKGENLEGETWTIGIEQPNEQRIGGLFDAIQLHDQGMATSGNYRNFRIVNGKKVAHTIDPVTGYPKMQTLLSATILAPNCMLADGYATACMVMGLEGSKNLVETHPELEGYFIYADENGEMVTYISTGLKGKTLKDAK
ncbi:FAD:protein FMN transferase [Roseivirga pacifica]|uniref:FAD:protein FMN transferase n=1 Tax=Roseivirga pacifica TaxID=1267423 RepID=UPI003BAFA33B